MVNELSIADLSNRKDGESEATEEGKQIPFDAAQTKVIEHLICGAAAAVGNRKELVHVASVEIRHAPGADVPVGNKRFERGNSMGKRNAAAPMQQIQVEIVGSQALEAALARDNRSLPRCVVRVDLADQKNVVALTLDCLSDYFLSATVAVHLGGVDQRHPEVDSQLQCGDFALAVARTLPHLPSPEAENGHQSARWQRNARQLSGHVVYEPESRRR